MFSSILTASFVAALVPQALANLYITSPVASTICTAGTTCNINWNDDGTQPPLTQIGSCHLGLYIGSQFTQFELQSLGTVNVAQQASTAFTPQGNIGGNSDLYFIRFTSLNFTSGVNPWEGFSAKFTLNGMTGTFNATELSYMTGATGGVSSSVSGGVVSTTSSRSSPLTTSSGSIVTSTKSTVPSTTSKSTATTTASQGAAASAFGSSHIVAFTVVIVSAFFAAAAF